MVCPNCGKDMRDDMLYCENCGNEIQFVPDFEPEIEQSISDTLSEIKIQYSENNSYNEYSEEYDSGEQYDSEYSDYSEYSNENQYDNYEANDADISDDLEYLDGEYYEEEYYEDEYSEENFSDEYSEEYIDEEYSEEYDEEDFHSYLDDDEYYIEDDTEDDFLGDPFDDFDYEVHLFKKFINFIRFSKLKWLLLLFIVSVIAAGVFVSIKVSNKLLTENSVEYQSQMAAEAASKGDYYAAIEYMEKALAIDSSDSSRKYQLSEYYFSNKEDEKAILMLWEIINEGGINKQAAYKKIINYYSDKEDYEMIEKIISNSNDESLIAEYGNYLALCPEFSIPEGTYEDAITVILTADVGGTIYYTLDGSEPTTDSDIFYAPIELTELGIYTISAIYVNSYGIVSEPIKKTYTIDISTPKAPNVILDSGVYNIPLMIEVDVQNYCSVYYTTDGTLPTIFSNEYTGPIPMPIGKSHFIFIAMSNESIWGEVTEVDYELKLNSDVDINLLTQKLLNYDLILGKTVDTLGYLPGNSSKYVYQVSSAMAYNKNDGSIVDIDHGQENEEDIPDTEKVKDIKVNDIDIYYLIVETMVDDQDNTMKTGNYFLCNTEDGSLYKANKTEEGTFLVGDEITEEYYTIPEPVLPEVPVMDNYDPNAGVIPE